MRARHFVVLEIASQNPPQRRFVPHNDVIQALAANRSDQTFHIWILPRRSRSRDHLFDPHALREGNNCSSENRISIPHQIQEGPPGLRRRTPASAQILACLRKITKTTVEAARESLVIGHSSPQCGGYQTP